MAQDRPLEIKDIPFTGKLITSVNAVMVGENFSQLVNMRYNDVSIEMIGGMGKINTTALTTYLKVRNGFHYRKSQPQESHVLVQAYNTGLTASQLLQNTTAIPSAGDFSGTALYTDSTGASIGRFSYTPNGEVAYCNGVDTLIWPGDEQRISGFYNYNPDGTFSYDFTEEVQNTLTTDFATVTNSAGGIDSSTMLLLHLDNNVTDSSPTTAHTVTNNNVTFSTTKVFGTHSAVFNDSNAYLTVPDDADFDFSGGSFTIDGRFRVDSLSGINPIFHQSITTSTIPYNSGSTEPSIGDTISGAVSSETAVIHAVVLDSGTWGGGNAAGTFYVISLSGAFNNPENIDNDTTAASNIASTNGATGIDDSEDHLHCWIGTDGSVNLQVYEDYEGGATVTVATPASTIAINTWYHIAFVENGDDWYIFVDGILKGYASDTSRCENYTNVVEIGRDDTGTNYYDGYMDEYRVSNTARWTTDFDIPSTAYTAADTAGYFYVGSIRPLKGIKFYVGTANTATGSPTVQYWNGSTWITAGSIVDGTASGGVTLAQTGTITFTDTESTAKLKYLNQIYIYWYKVYFDDVDSTTTIYQVTGQASMQSIKDIWDGQLRTCFSFQIYDGTTYSDNTINVKEEDYTSANTATFANLSSLASTSYIVAGFIEKQSGISFTFVGGSGNSTACTATVSYWNGASWTSVGNIDDLTIESGASFAKSGTITWNTPSAEYKQTIGKEYQLYYYKIAFTATLDADVKLDQVKGIPAQEDLKGYKFPVMAGDRLWLCSDQSGMKNSALVSAFGTSVVFNGDDSQRFYFGDDNELTAGTAIYSQFGSSLYDITIICKDTETWIVTGNSPITWTKFKASDRIGCPAPLTMVTGHMDVDITPGLNRYVAIWQAADGIYIFDGRTFFPIHKDIEDVFDKRNTNGINRSKIGDSVGFFDNQNKEYHWLWASGSSTTLDKEYVFDIKRLKWYTNSRSTALQYGMEVIDTNGNSYNYGFIDTGYMERLEYGNDSDGTAITATWETGDMFVGGSPLIETTVRIAKMVMNGKANTSNNVSLYHYGDGNTTATTDARSLSPSGSIIQMPLKTEGLGPYTTHRFKATMTTNDEVIGFEPLLFSIAFKRIRIDKN